MKMREVSIKYGTTKKRNLRTEQEEIEISITSLEEQLTHSNVNDKQNEELLTPSWSALHSSLLLVIVPQYVCLNHLLPFIWPVPKNNITMYMYVVRAFIISSTELWNQLITSDRKTIWHLSSLLKLKSYFF